jgi:hypothetical protein
MYANGNCYFACGLLEELFDDGMKLQLCMYVSMYLCMQTGTVTLLVACLKSFLMMA